MFNYCLKTIFKIFERNFFKLGIIKLNINKRNKLIKDLENIHFLDLEV